MGRTGPILEYLASVTEAPAEVKVDPGGDAITSADFFLPPGVDARPLAGDFAACMDGPGTGEDLAVGCNDPLGINRSAEAGECRLYARNALGTATAEVWCKANGEVHIASLNGSKVVINGVEIDASGNITTSGNVSGLEVTATKTSVSLSTHNHPTAPTGPVSPPTPGS